MYHGSNLCLPCVYFVSIVCLSRVYLVSILCLSCIYRVSIVCLPCVYLVSIVCLCFVNLVSTVCPACTMYISKGFPGIVEAVRTYFIEAEFDRHGRFRVENGFYQHVHRYTQVLFKLFLLSNANLMSGS